MGKKGVAPPEPQHEEQLLDEKTGGVAEEAMELELEEADAKDAKEAAPKAPKLKQGSLFGYVAVTDKDGKPMSKEEMGKGKSNDKGKDKGKDKKPDTAKSVVTLHPHLCATSPRTHTSPPTPLHALRRIGT
jgi:hypothetical protein